MEPQGIKRKLTAILCADVKGYSRLMGENEEATLATLSAYREMMDSLVDLHHGRVVGSAGDSLLADFTSVVDAVQCAVEIQRELKTRNAELPEDRKMEFRMGVNLGDVIVKGDDIYGDGVNIAARLETMAEPGGICISGGVYEQLKNKLALAYEDLGKQKVKNISDPVQTYRIDVDGGAPGHGVSKKTRPRRWQIALLASVLILAAGALATWSYSLRPSGTPVEVATVAGPETTAALQLPEQASIAVLPFVNLSGDPEQDSFADGITENIITDLSNLENLIVIARNSVFTYKGKSVKVQQVGLELGVRYILEGSVQKSADKVRITAQLVDATTGHHQWADRYDRELNDIFTLQDEITEKVVRTLAGFAVVPGAAGRVYEGIGIIVEVDPSKSRLVVDHLEIKGYMAPMVMGFAVKPRSLLEGLKPGATVRFTIDADERVIVDLQPVHE